MNQEGHEYSGEMALILTPQLAIPQCSIQTKQDATEEDPEQSSLVSRYFYFSC